MPRRLAAQLHMAFDAPLKLDAANAWVPAMIFLLALDVRQEGAEVDAKTTTGVTALWLAAGEGRKAVAADLIAKGADVNNRRTDGITAVMAAAVGGHKVSCV